MKNYVNRRTVKGKNWPNKKFFYLRNAARDESPG